MDKLAGLYAIAFESDINIVNFHFSETKKAACLYRRPHKNILLDKSLINSSHEEGAILSEEIGHFETGALYRISSTYNTPVARSNRIKFEAQARHWAFKTYLPPDEITKGIEHAGHNLFDVAEHCQVTAFFLKRAIDYYATNGFFFPSLQGYGDV